MIIIMLFRFTMTIMMDISHRHHHDGHSINNVHDDRHHDLSSFGHDRAGIF